MWAALDLGSNSFRVLCFDEKNKQILGEYEKVVGTARGLKNDKQISKEALDKIIFAINESKKLLGFEPKNSTAYTTAALRYAKNKQQILASIFDATGVNFEIISAKKEAKLTLRAIKNALKREKIENNDFLALDIGGGSSELMIQREDKSFIKSFDFGIVTLFNECENFSELDKLENVLNKKTIELKDFLKDSLGANKKELKEFIFISTAGTSTTLAALKHKMHYKNYDKKKINTTKIYLKDLDFEFKRIKTLSENEIIEILGKGQKEFILIGIMILKKFYELLDKDYSIVIDDGLREGIMSEYYAKFK